MGNSSTHPYIEHYDNDNDDENTSPIYEFYFPFVLFCIVVSTYIVGCIKYNFLVREKDNEGCVLEHLRYIRASNPKKLTLGHLNINSIPNKFDGIMDIVSTNLDVFLISETKIDSSFPEAQFLHDGYSKPHRKDRSLCGGRLLMYMDDNIPSRILNQHTIPDDVEIMCVEINLKKQKWITIGIYRPPSMNERYFIDHLGRVIDFYSKIYDRFVIMRDFNSEPTLITFKLFATATTYTT